MDTAQDRKSISIKTPAKINLGLLVKEKREDGYHNIETIFLSISLFDEVSLSLKPEGIEVISSSKDIPKDETNLAYRAADVFLSHLSLKKGIRIHIKKSIPVGRGLGGGSSDAASVLWGLNKLLHNPLKFKELLRLALLIGSDVPFFLYTGASYAISRGEVLTPLPLLPFSILLYIPPYPISTKWAYNRLDTLGLTNAESSLKIVKEKIEKGQWRDMGRYLRNTFEDLVFPLHPDLREMKERFLKSGALGAGLSGTGSAVYGLVEKGKERGIREKGVLSLRAIDLGRRLFGRTQDFGSWKGGSNPPAPVSEEEFESL